MLKQIAVTVDVETDWGGRLPMQGSNTAVGIKEKMPAILEILDEHDIRATFFVSGEVVAHCHHILSQILDYGHEIASHGFRHMQYTKLSRMELRNQIVRSKQVIREQIGANVLGFRAPQLSFSLELIEILADLGFRYDSSMIKGFFPGRYVNLTAPSKPFLIQGVWEIPVTNLPFVGFPMGLLWINAMGFGMFKWLFEKLEFSDTIVFYLHPFDLLACKPDRDPGFVIKEWYGYKSNKAQATLNRLISYWKSQKVRFRVLRDIVTEGA